MVWGANRKRMDHGGIVFEFNVLGPVTVRRDGVPVPLRAAMLRRLLAVLICSAGQPVSADELVDALWPDSPPLTARKTLQVYVVRLRRALTDRDRIGHGPAGYTLAMTGGELDAGRFAELVTLARTVRATGDAVTAADTYGRALALWRGRPYADIAGVTVVDCAAREWAERRLAAIQERTDVELALGRHVEVVPQLSGLVGRHPYRERLREQLMIALYRSGRQVEALELYRSTCRLFADELGLRPGPGLESVHQAILSGTDPLLARVPV